MTSPSNRFTLKILMGLIGFLAVGLGAMRVGSMMADRLSMVITSIALIIVLLGAIVRRGEGAWVGFALFGWFAFGTSLIPPIGPNPRIDPAAELVNWLVQAMHPQVGEGPSLPELNSQFMEMLLVVPFGQLMTDPRARALLSPSEAEKYDAFVGRWQTHEDASLHSQMRRFHAVNIGHHLFALLFGCLGAVAGRFLSITELRCSNANIGAD